MSGEETGSPRPPRATPLGFRPDIQGLRAVAVLLVIAHHLGLALSGGYVGVDVFFVVSGYLITALLVRETDRTGRISLSGFYARRARRILPAATLVTLATVLGSLATLAMLRTQTVITDAIWATLFAGNIRFALVGTDYFAQGQPPSPLRHYWSLAVEEQFYLLWPLLLLACVWGVRRWKGGSREGLHRTAGGLLALVVALSLGWSAWATHDSPTTAYYSTLARAWELALGAACALVPGLLSGRRTVRELLAWGGLLAVVAAAVGFTVRTPFPGLSALLPVLGAAALVVAGSGPGTTTVGRALSTTPMVRIGDWSYSLYLWHWPVIVLLRSNLGPERFSTLPVQAGALLLTVVLSWATFRWVETPFRTARPWRRTSRALVIYPASVTLVVAVAVASTQVLSYRLGGWADAPAISRSDYAGQRLGSDPHRALVRASVLAAEEGRAVPADLEPGLLGLRGQTAELGDCDYRTGTRRLCAIGDPDADRTIVVLGDSHARAWSPAVEQIGREHGYRVHVLVYSGCMATDLSQVEPRTSRVWDDCERFKDWAMTTIGDLDPELVVVATAAGKVVDPATDQVRTNRRIRRYLDVLREGWRRLFVELGERADRVVVVGNTPKLPREPGVCLSRGDPDLGACAFEPRRANEREARASFDAARDAGAGVVDARGWFCSAGVCPAVVGHFITMRDSHHVTPAYARWLADPLADRLDLARADD